MDLLPCWLCLLLVVVVVQDTAGKAPMGHPKEPKTESREKQLMTKLLSRYERYGVIGRPVNDSKIQVFVRYGIQLFQILDLDENKQILRTNCWSLYNWDDTLLRWDNTEFHDISSVRIFPDQIWTPDIKLYNFADERLNDHRRARVVIDKRGSTLWVPQALLKSTCEVEISYFPFDTQVCMLEFGSWTYDQTQMDIGWWLSTEAGNEPMPYVDFSDYVSSNEWTTDGELEPNKTHWERVKQIRSVKKCRRRNQTVGSEMVTRNYPTLRYLIRMHRNPSFYVFMLVIPCVLLSSLTLVVFWLPPESPAKMMLGMNIFVAFFVLLLLLAESTPSAVKNFPLIGVFFCLNMILITLSTFLATLVIHLYFRGDRNGPVPTALRRYVIEGVGRLILVRQSIPLPKVKKSTTTWKKSSEKGLHKRYPAVHQERAGAGAQFTPPYGDTFSEADPERSAGMRSYLAYPPADGGIYPPMHGGDRVSMPRLLPGQQPVPAYMGSYYPVGAGCHRELTAAGMMGFPGCAAAYQHSRQPTGGGNAPISNPVGASDGQKVEPLPHGSGKQGESPLLLTASEAMERDVREVKRYVKMFVNRQKDIARKGLVAMEWRTLALIIDRLFFFIYITTVAIAVIVLVPKSTENEVPESFRSSDPFCS